MYLLSIERQYENMDCVTVRTVQHDDQISVNTSTKKKNKAKRYQKYRKYIHIFIS